MGPKQKINYVADLLKLEFKEKFTAEIKKRLFERAESSGLVYQTIDSIYRLAQKAVNEQDKMHVQTLLEHFLLELEED